MFVADQLSPFLLGDLAPAPRIVGWNRLEGRPRAEDFERSLRAEVRDPLWFLTRQWQLGELEGEDAGSPIDARVAMRRNTLARYAPRAAPARLYDPATPLEAIVEREVVPNDLVTHIQICRSFLRRLRPPVDADTVKTLYRSAYPLDITKITGAIETETTLTLPLAFSQLFDGVAFLAAVRDGSHAATAAGFGLGATVTETLVAAATDVLTWFDALYSFPRPGDVSAWAPSQLEYQFACATDPAGAAQTVLVADDYAQGHLDWFSFDIDNRRGAHLGQPENETRKSIEETLSFLPVSVSFGGMPSARYWEMEDRKIEFADLDAHTTDLAKLLLTEFCLIFSNDWCVVPHEVEVGTLCEIDGIVVTDVFGERTLVRAAGRGPDESWQRWAMFGLSTRAAGDVAGTTLFIPPATPKLLESDPIERVVFLRDEMANMAWAVERVVPSGLGEGTDGNRLAYERRPAAPAPLPLPEGVPVRYHFGTDVPLNWRPFIPVHVPNSIRSVRLQRGRLPESDDISRPILGRIINEPAPYYVNEEEVPRAGQVVTRSFQRTRWLHGRIVLWLGRRATTGRGEGSSGLAFDQIEQVKK
jgi:hypothetical protein